MMKETKSKISIIMPAYNAEKNIKTSINSVINQDYYDWELIVINDCSTDNTRMIIEDFKRKDNRIILINLKSNQGVANARNSGIQHAQGDYIAFLDSDDYWVESKLSKQIGAMENNNWEFSFSNYFVVDEYDKVIGKRIVPNHLDYKQLLKSNHIGCLTVMSKACLIKKYPMENIGHEDYLTWLKILKSGVNAYNVNETLAYYRVGEQSISSNKIKAAKWQWKIYREELEISLLGSVFYFVFYIFEGIKKNFFLK